MNRVTAKQGSVVRRNSDATPQVDAFHPCGYATATLTAQKTDQMKTHRLDAVRTFRPTNPDRLVTTTSSAVSIADASSR
jgi:hypothetical protein